VLTILYLPMGLMGIPSRFRQRNQGKDEGARNLLRSLPERDGTNP